MHDVIFLGMRIEKEVETLVNSKEKTITAGMSESELKAYKIGVSNTISAIDTIVNSEDDYTPIVQIRWLEKPEEFTVEDFMSLFEDEVE